ncbi:MAG: site-2 protease family protein [Blastocatellia bacterium]
MKLALKIRQFQIGRLFGIPLIIDYSWLPIALLHIWMVSDSWMFYRVRPPLPFWQNLLIGAVVTAIFFASVLIHELAHAMVARLEGIQIHDIQLHIFGGWARLVEEPRTALAELRVAVAGPGISFLLAIFFWLWLFVVQQVGERSQSSRAAAAAFLYLAAANLLLAMFNLLPGLPLDGGRVLRAWLWHRRGDILSATRTTKRMGIGIAYMLISYGLFLWGYGIVRGRLWQDFIVAVWMFLIGIFLKRAAESDYRHRQQQAASKQNHEQWNQSGTVGSVMRSPAVSILPELQINEFIDDVLSSHRLTNFAVAREGRLHGVLSLARLRELPREDWPQTRVSDVMEPISEDLFIPARASLEHAEHKLKTNALGFLAVIDQDGLLIGQLTDADVKRAA